MNYSSDRRSWNQKKLCLILLIILGAILLWVSVGGAEKSHTKVIRSSPASYTVEVGGNLDEFNTREYTGEYKCAFQPNVSITITNTGDTEIVNPRIVIDRRRDWYSLDDIVAEIVRPGMTDEEKAFAVWDWCRDNVSTGPGGGASLWAENASVVRFMNTFGVGACGTFHLVMPLIAQYVGVDSDSGVLADGSHAVQRQYWGGQDRYLDCMLTHGRGPEPGGPQPKGHFALNLDNRTVAGIKELAADHYLMDRASPGDYLNAVLHGPGSGFWAMKKDWKDPRTMAFTLRPGESIVRLWKLTGSGWLEGDLKSNATGYMRYTPDLTESQVRRYAKQAQNIKCESTGLRAANPSLPAEIIYEMSSPYVLTGGRIAMLYEARSADRGSVSLMVSFDGDEWKTVWESDAPGRAKADVTLEGFEEFRENTYTHSFLVRATIGPGGGMISKLWMEAEFQTYIPSLPSLAAGIDTVQYVDDTRGPRSVTINHRWHEATGEIPGAPQLKSPVGSAESPFDTSFRWSATGNAKVDAFEFCLSARPDMAWPLLPPYHTVIYSANPEFRAPSPGAFIDGDTYHWKVRARSTDGAWGDWSETASFVARGPGGSSNLRPLTDDNERLVLHWDPPTSGTTPVRYEVYGAQEPAFSPLRESWSGEIWGHKGITRPVNLIGDTQETSFDVTDCPAAFFRVIAVDKAGSRSVPTNVLELPHPTLLQSDTVSATAGKRLRFALPVRKSIGKLVWSLREGPVRENPDDLSFKLVDGPDWLRVIASSGVVTGIPPSPGEYFFTAEVSSSSGTASSRRYTISVR